MADHDSERVTLARLPSGVAVETTVHTYGSGDPVVYAQAAQHGREINGTAVLRRLHDYLLDADLDGTFVAVPVADPLTFDTVSYTTPEAYDSVNNNMNRCWPGDPDGSVHERMAAALWEYVGDADYIVDLHTGSRDMLTHSVYLQGDDDCRRLAEAFGTRLLLAEAAGDDADVEWEERNFGGKLRVAATREGIPAITPELAHNKELVSDAIGTGVEGTKNVLRETGVLDDGVDVPEWTGVRARNHLGRVKATDAGLFSAAGGLAVGNSVEEGETVGELFDPTTYETLQTATADRAGVVYSVTREATVTAGETLVGVAMRLDDE
ncbi:succinylglutamate desuccinylase/aspartoacylase family protein [Candidatus Halobonum tyrrellensis]|uniref:Deacylase n=1 Tax=Candidatus Halobonum tyrrellensis G22 TaxID=1324957 RepID=V4HDN3_9EURY|nr:succinylglutamate desuccinylase/aspartoacylase family protein [Candidatus Halobonum tyrrellensis]ESP88188.1 deacylase [Candidatus Halobonum tyrrellensis G22]